MTWPIFFFFRNTFPFPLASQNLLEPKGSKEHHILLCFLWEDMHRGMLFWFSGCCHNVPARRAFLCFSPIEEEGDFVIRISVPVALSLKIGHLTVSPAIWPLNTNIYIFENNSQN